MNRYNNLQRTDKSLKHLTKILNILKKRYNNFIALTNHLLSPDYRNVITIE
jgi:hypothetical protein